MSTTQYTVQWVLHSTVSTTQYTVQWLLHSTQYS